MSVMVVPMIVVMTMIMIMVMHVIHSLHVAAARHHENMAVGAKDLDIGAIQSRQHRCVDYLVHRAQHRLPIPEIENTVERTEQLVELVSAEQNGYLSLAANGAHDVNRDFLMAGVETDQGLVEQQQFRMSDERLRQKKPLPFSTGHL